MQKTIHSVSSLVKAMHDIVNTDLHLTKKTIYAMLALITPFRRKGSHTSQYYKRAWWVVGVFRHWNLPNIM